MRARVQMFDALGLKGKRAFANPLKPPPGHVDEPLIEPPLPPPPPTKPPMPPPKMPPPSAPRPQPAMHAAAKS